jgi:hypothetical protein
MSNKTRAAPSACSDPSAGQQGVACERRPSAPERRGRDRLDRDVDLFEARAGAGLCDRHRVVARAGEADASCGSSTGSGHACGHACRGPDLGDPEGDRAVAKDEPASTGIGPGRARCLVGVLGGNVGHGLAGELVCGAVTVDERPRARTRRASALVDGLRGVAQRRREDDTTGELAPTAEGARPPWRAVRRSGQAAGCGGEPKPQRQSEYRTGLH